MGRAPSKITLLKPLAAIVLVLCAACGGEPPELSEDDVLKEPTPSTENTPDTPVEGTALEKSVLKKLAPSMVTVQFKGDDLASGFLVEGNYVVTAAHVVWGLPEIGVVFEDGTKHGDVTVAGYDHFADLAFLGPVDTPAPPVVFAETNSLAAGDTVFNVGNPKGPEGLLITKGDYRSTFEWPEADVVFVYSSAEGKDGMSGGAIVNERGQVIGVHAGSNDRVSSGTSSETVKDRLGKLARGEAITVLGPRELPQRKDPDVQDGSHEHRFVLRDRWDTVTLILEGSRKRVEFDSYRDVEYGLFDVRGKGAFRPPFQTVQDTLTDRYGGVLQCCFGGTGLIDIRQRFDIERQVTLKSLGPLVQRDDPDDGRRLPIGEAVAGAMDTPGDIDRYTIDLAAGESIAIRLAAFNRMSVTIEHADAPPYDVVSREVYFDEIKYRAPVDATYTVALQMNPGDFFRPLGYTVTALKSWAEPNQLGRSGVFHTPVGKVLRHSFHHSVPRIHIDYPTDVVGGDKEAIAAEFFEQDRWGRTVALEKSDLSHHRRRPNEVLSVDNYMVRSVLSTSYPYKGLKVVTARREIETPSGAPILIEDFEADNGGMKGVRLAYIHDGKTGFMAIFYAPGEVFEEWRPVVDYCIGSFSIGAFSVADAMTDE